MGTTVLPFRSVVLHIWDNQMDQIKLLTNFIDSIPDELKEYVIGPIDLINGKRVIQFLPTGSKVGWAPATTMNLLWDKFKTLLTENFEFPMYLDYQIAGDMRMTYINETSDNMIDISVMKKQVLKTSDIYGHMIPVHMLIEKINNDNPELFIKYSELIEAIITESGMRDLKTDGRILVNQYS